MDSATIIAIVSIFTAGITIGIGTIAKGPTRPMARASRGSARDSAATASSGSQSRVTGGPSSASARCL